MLPDRNLPVACDHGELWAAHGLGSELLRSLPGQAYWALLRDDPQQRPLVALYRLSEDGQAPAQVPQELLERSQLQQRAQRLWRSLLPLWERDEARPGMLWLLLAPEGVEGGDPPAHNCSGVVAAPATPEVRADELLTQLSERFSKPGLDQLQERLEMLSRLTENPDSGRGPFSEDFFRAVASSLGHHYGDDLARRCAGGENPPAPPSRSAGEDEETRRQNKVRDALTVDPLGIEVGRALIPLVDPDQGTSMYHRIFSIRMHMVSELGIILPGVRFRDHSQLAAHAYRIKVRDQEVARGQLIPDRFLAIAPEAVLERFPGELTHDPTYGMPGKWITGSLRREATALGAMVFDPVSVMATHLSEVVRHYAPQLLPFEDAVLLIHRKEQVALRQALADRGVDDVKIWKVLRELLSELVSIRDLTLIMESFLDAPDESVEQLTERARHALLRQLNQQHLKENEPTPAVILTAEEERVLMADPNARQELTIKLCERFEAHKTMPLFICSPACRRLVRDLVRQLMPAAVVLSTQEVLARAQIRPLS